MMKLRGFSMVAVLFCCSYMAAQDDGYLLELGLGGGGSFYMGDANSTLYANTNGVFSAIVRYNLNPRLFFYTPHLSE